MKGRYWEKTTCRNEESAMDYSEPLTRSCKDMQQTENSNANCSTSPSQGTVKTCSELKTAMQIAVQNHTWLEQTGRYKGKYVIQRTELPWKSLMLGDRKAYIEV